MSNSPLTSQSLAWDDADAFLGRLDHLAHAESTTRNGFFGELLSGVVAHGSANWAVAEVLSGAGREIVAEMGDRPENFEELPEAVRVRGGIDREAELVIHYRPAGGAPREIHRGRDLVEAACEIATVYLLRERYEELKRQHEASLETQRWMARIEAAATVEETSRHLTLFLQAITGWDRVSVVRCGAWGSRLIAASGSRNIDRRSPQVKALERTVHEVQRDGDASPAKAAYESQHRCTAMELQPVTPASVIVYEHFRPAAPALPAEESIDRPLQLLAERLDRQTRGLASTWFAYSTLPAGMKSLVVAGSVVLICLAAFLIPWTLTVSAVGRMLPAERESIFAPAAGVIAREEIDSGQRVERGDFLVEIESPELELVEQRLVGDLATLRTELSGVRAGRIGRRESGSPGLRTGFSESSTEQLLLTKIEGLEKQLSIVAEQKTELTLRAPLTGVIHRMDDGVSLSGRPVVAGQYLCDVYDEQNAWSAELDVAEHDMGYVLAAKDRGDLQVEIATATEPGRWYDVEVSFVDSTARINERGEVVVRMRCLIPTDTLLDSTRIGSGVTARIRCGRASLLFVWTRELIEAIQNQGLF